MTLLLGQEFGARSGGLRSSHGGELEVLSEALLEGETLKLARLLAQLPGVEGFVARQELLDGGNRSLSCRRSLLVAHVGSIA
jgi:hypothetical protein